LKITFTWLSWTLTMKSDGVGCFIDFPAFDYPLSGFTPI
jgi:hypothetical protein